jgi:hypothetical protein
MELAHKHLWGGQLNGKMLWLGGKETQEVTHAQPNAPASTGINPVEVVFLHTWINSRTMPVIRAELTKTVLLSREGMRDTSSARLS